MRDSASTHLLETIYFSGEIMNQLDQTKEELLFIFT